MKTIITTEEMRPHTESIMQEILAAQGVSLDEQRQMLTIARKATVHMVAIRIDAPTHTTK